MILGLAVACGLIAYVEVILRRERISGLRARQSITDRRLLRVQSAIDRIERRLDAMTLDRELVAGAVAPPPSPCLDCGVVDAHTEECALSMDGLTESPTDAAARRGRD